MKKKKKTQGQINKERYIAAYDKEHYKMYAFKIRKNNVVVIDKLENVENKSKYITNLIEDDIKKEG